MADYDPAQDGHDSYYVAIEEKRRRKEWTDRLTAAKRVEFIGDCVMIEGDCLDLIEQVGRVDACLTDPPYGIGRDGQAKTTGGHGGRKAYEFKGWDKTRPDERIFSRIFMYSGTQIIWGGNYFADMLPASGKWFVWDKGQRINQSDCELAYTSMDGALRIFELNRVALMVEGAVHPTQKPIELMKWCIGHLPLTAKTILDPFMGSGTTGVACVKTGRKFIGIELDPDYFDIACKRVREAYAQPDLFIAEKPKAVVQEGLAL